MEWRVVIAANVKGLGFCGVYAQSFFHGNRDFYMDVKTLDDVKKLKNKIWD